MATKYEGDTCKIRTASWILDSSPSFLVDEDSFLDDSARLISIFTHKIRNYAHWLPKRCLRVIHTHCIAPELLTASHGNSAEPVAHGFARPTISVARV